MVAALFAWWLAAPLSCSYQVRWDDACKKTFTMVCVHEAQCGFTGSETECEFELKEQFICDPSATLDDFRACHRATEIPDCDELIQTECLNVLCDSEIGCVEITEDTCRQNDMPGGCDTGNEL